MLTYFVYGNSHQNHVQITFSNSVYLWIQIKGIPQVRGWSDWSQPFPVAFCANKRPHPPLSTVSRYPPPNREVLYLIPFRALYKELFEKTGIDNVIMIVRDPVRSSSECQNNSVSLPVIIMEYYPDTPKTHWAHSQSVSTYCFGKLFID